MGKPKEFFRKWMDDFKAEEKKEEPELRLHSARESYEKTAKYQMRDYIRKVDNAIKRGKEYCDLICSEPYPMRPEHVEYFLKKGYDICWTELDLKEEGKAYYYKAVWTEEAEGRLRNE